MGTSGQGYVMQHQYLVPYSWQEEITAVGRTMFAWHCSSCPVLCCLPAALAGLALSCSSLQRPLPILGCNRHAPYDTANRSMKIIVCHSKT